MQSLYGTGPLAMALYLVLLRLMDWGSGLVGAACPISRHGLCAQLVTEVVRGKGCSEERPSVGELRAALAKLERSGLIERVGNEELLVFRMRLAYAGNVRQKNAQPSDNRLRNPVIHSLKPSSGAGLRVVSQGDDNRGKTACATDVFKSCCLSTQPAAESLPREGVVDNSAAASNAENDEATMARKSALIATLKDKGITPPSGDQRVRGWVASGYSVAQLTKAIDTARLRREEAGSDAPVNIGLIDRILTDEFSGKTGNDQTQAQARALGMVALPGESWEAFRRRVRVRQQEVERG
jgi:hypothetical protein